MPDSFQPLLSIETSRGCWWGQFHRCSFCGLGANTDMNFRSKSPERAMKEINYLREKYAAGSVHKFFTTDNILDNRYYKTLLPELAEKNIGVSFGWEVKANIKKEQMALLSKAGVTFIQPGIESLNEDVLKLINKGTTRLINISTLKWGKQFGVNISWNLLYGFPGEDPLEYKRTLRLIPLLYHLEPPILYQHVRFERFSRYINNPSFFGIKKLKPLRVYYLIYHGLDKDLINDIAFNFDVEYDDYSGSYAQELQEAVELWQLRATEASLSLFSRGDSITIEDTRNQQNKRKFSYEGLAARLYLLCDTAKSLASLLQASKITGYLEEKQAEMILDEFIKEGLMIKDSNKYLSLAVTR